MLSGADRAASIGSGGAAHRAGCPVRVRVYEHFQVCSLSYICSQRKVRPAAVSYERTRTRRRAHNTRLTDCPAPRSRPRPARLSNNIPSGDGDNHHHHHPPLPPPLSVSLRPSHPCFPAPPRPLWTRRPSARDRARNQSSHPSLPFWRRHNSTPRHRPHPGAFVPTSPLSASGCAQLPLPPPHSYTQRAGDRGRSGRRRLFLFLARPLVPVLTDCFMVLGIIVLPPSAPPAHPKTTPRAPFHPFLAAKKLIVRFQHLCADSTFLHFLYR